MTFWPLTSYSDFPTDQTFQLFHDLYTGLDLHRITCGFHGSFSTGVASQQGTLTLPDTWFHPQLWGLAYTSIVETSFTELAVSFLDYLPWIPLGTFSILLVIKRSVWSLQSLQIDSSKSRLISSSAGSIWPNNCRNRGCLLTIHHRCTCEWEYTGMLSVFLLFRAKTYEFRFVWIKRMLARQQRGTLRPLECQLSDGSLFRCNDK